MVEKDLIPKELLSNKTFREDVAKFFRTESAVLEKLRSNLPTQPSQLRNDDFLKSAAGRMDLDVAEYKDLSVIARMLVAASVSEAASSQEVVDFLVEKLPLSASSDERQRVESFIDSVAKNDVEIEGVDAFSFGDTFLGVEFKQLVSIADLEKRSFHFGGNLTVDYYDAASNRKAISVNISHRELTGLVAELQRELDLLNEAKSKLGGAHE